MSPFGIISAGLGSLIFSLWEVDKLLIAESVLGVLDLSGSTVIGDTANKRGFGLETSKTGVAARFLLYAGVRGLPVGVLTLISEVGVTLLISEVGVALRISTVGVIIVFISVVGVVPLFISEVGVFLWGSGPSKGGRAVGVVPLLTSDTRVKSCMVSAGALL